MDPTIEFREQPGPGEGANAPLIPPRAERSPPLPEPLPYPAEEPITPVRQIDAAALRGAILSAHHALKPRFEAYKLDGDVMHLAPSDVTNVAFSALVHLSTGVYPRDVSQGAMDSISPPLREEIREIC